MEQNEVHISGSEESGENVLLPCQFCGKLEPPDNLTLHQSGCEYNPFLPHSFGLFGHSDDDDDREPLVELDEKLDLRRRSHVKKKDSSSGAKSNMSFKIKQMVNHDVFDITKKEDGGYMLKRAREPREEKTPETSDDDSNPGDDVNTPETGESDRNIQFEDNSKEQVMRQCELCDCYLPSDVMDEHLNFCEARPFECPKCFNLVLWVEREAHNFICSAQFQDEDEFGSVERSGEATAENYVNELTQTTENTVYYVNHDDEDFELSDDNNEENETVESFIRKALLATANLKRTVHDDVKNISTSA